MCNFPLIFQRKRRNSLCRHFSEMTACYEDTNRYFSATTTHNAYTCCTMGFGDSWSKQLGKNHTTPVGEKSQFLPLSTVGEAAGIKPQHLSADPVLPQGYRLTSCPWEAMSSLPFRHPSRGAHHLPTGSAFLQCLICMKPPRRLRAVMVISASSPAPDRAINCCPSPASRPLCKQRQCLWPEAAQLRGHLTWLQLEAAETRSQEAPAQPGLLHLGQPQVSPHYLRFEHKARRLNSFPEGTQRLSTPCCPPRPARKASLPGALLQVCLVTSAN